MRLLIACGCALLALAPAAQAKHRLSGVVPDVPSGGQVHAQARAQAANLSYHGGPVLHRNRTHVIFWQPSGSGLSFDSGYESLIERFLRGVGADSHRPTNVYSLTGQYHDDQGPAAYASVYAGAIVATDRLPANGCAEPPTAPLWTHCMSDQQLVAEINHVVRSRKLPQSSPNIYFLLTPNGLGSCETVGPDNCALGGMTPGGYCGYHNTTSDGLLYAVIPYNAVNGHCQSGNPRPNSSTADPTLSTLSHEHNETITDPEGDGWISNSYYEDGDLCIKTYGPRLGGSGSGIWNEVIGGHHYYLQAEWSNDNHSCQARDEADHVSFTTTGRARAGNPIKFAAHASDPDGSVRRYAWFFGDRQAAAGRRVAHAFKRVGRYRVLLRTTDVDGNWAFSARRIRIT